jgi:arylsulfatase
MSRHPRATILAACLLGLPLLSAGCSPGREERPAHDPVPTAAPEPIAPPPEKIAVPEEPFPEPLPAPAAYFGDLGLERVVDPMMVKPVEKGSVLLIVSEALNAKHLGAYGYHRKTSPNIDKLARGGLVLTNFFSTSSWTRPSFTSIVTGLPKREHRMELGCPPLNKNIETLAERFAEAGYKTAGFVGNPLTRAKWGFGQGYDTYVDAEVLDDYGLADDAALVRRAAAWIQEHSGEPFFVLVFLTGPHVPYRKTPAYHRFSAKLKRGHIIGIPKREYPDGIAADDLARTVAAYDGEVHAVDAQVGKLIAKLRQTKLLERTHVLVTADHGEIFGEHNCFLHGYHMWDPVLRVPFVLDSPSLTGSGLYDDRPFSHLDVIPTLLDLAGMDADPNLPGNSLVEALADPRAGRDRIIFSQHNAHQIRRQAIRKGRYKLVHHHAVERQDVQRLNDLHPHRDLPEPRDLPTVAWDAERYELYDMAADPGELNDLFAARKTAPETIELIAELAERLEGGEEVSIEIDDDLRQALESLGYIKRSN